MIDQRVLAGYPDGTFLPDQAVTRAEFATMVNQAFGFTGEVTETYPDVKPDSWFAKEIARAKNAGYLSGYADGTIRPNELITRQEMAAMLTRVMNLAVNDGPELGRFSDRDSVPAWSRAACAALVREGYLSGYQDGTLQVLNPTSRAMAAVILNQAMEKRTSVFDTAGTYGPEQGTQTINGNVVIDSAGITLRNLIIEGYLIISPDLAQEDVTLINVTVKGNTMVRGGKTSLTGAFNAVFLEGDQAGVTLSGQAASVMLCSPASGSGLDFAAGHYGTVTIAAGTSGTKVHVGPQTVIDNFYTYAPLDATGDGTVTTSYVHASGCTSTLEPQTRIIAPGVQPPVRPSAKPDNTGGGISKGLGQKPVLMNVSVGGLKPVVSGPSSKPVLTFDVDPATLYTQGTAELNRDVNYRIVSEEIPFFPLAGQADQDDNLGEMALDLLGAIGGGGSAADGGVMGSTLIDFSDLTITLKAGSLQTVYAVRFV